MTTRVTYINYFFNGNSTLTAIPLKLLPASIMPVCHICIENVNIGGIIYGNKNKLILFFSSNYICAQNVFFFLKIKIEAMDSLTQITLGAACGELVLGRKIGNRAMLWGAIGGTIPDLDILANGFLTDIEALAFHRGISHSLLFAVTTPFLFAYLTQQFYERGWYQQKAFKWIGTLFWGFFLLGVLGLLNLIPTVITGSVSYPMVGITIVLGLLALYRLWNNYLQVPLETVSTTYKDWTKLFFWSIFTHPLLDAFTAYGTQLFAPFSDYRVAFNTISVADPIYTFPFIAFLVAALTLHRTKKWRLYLTWMGILWSSAYLLFTVFNKQKIDRIFENALATQNIKYQRFRTSPSIFNNILWQGVAEAEDVYYLGMYSLFDTKPTVEFYPLNKDHELIEPYESNKDIQTLKWFSDGYYSIMKLPDGKLQLSDVRYGSTKENSIEPEDFVFRFIIDPAAEDLNIQEIRARENMDDAFGELFDRIKGR